MKIVFLGAPGSGKDTLANQFKLKYDYTILIPGKIFREMAKKETDLGLYAKNEYWGKGMLCPDNITNALVEKTFEGLSSKEKAKILFNGFPRSINQAEYLNNITTINMVIDLQIKEDIAVKRLLKRGREDDTEEVIRKRLNEYKEKTMPISNFYKKMPDCKYVLIDTDNDPNKVFEEAYTFVSDYIAKC